MNLHLNTKADKNKFNEIYKGHEVVVLACGAHQPRKITFPGSDDTVSAYDFLKDINLGEKPELKGRKVVVIGAGMSEWMQLQRRITAAPNQ